MAVIISGTNGISGVSTVNLANGSVTQNILANGVAGTGPAFSAYLAANQSAPSTSVWTKVALNAERFDTNNNFNTSTNRFIPTVAGYYQINGAINFVSGATSLCACALYVNGAFYKSGEAQTGATAYQILVSDLIYLNGSTDYVELYVYVSSTTALTGTAVYTGMSGSLVRAA